MENCYVIYRRLLETLKVPYTGKFRKEKILSHSQYPSLLCLSDTLEEYGIEYIAVKLGPDRLDDFPLPFIAKISIVNGSFFSAITAVSENSVSLFDEKGKQKDISRLDFLKSWAVMSLLVEAGDMQPKSIKRSVIKMT